MIDDKMIDDFVDIIKNKKLAEIFLEEKTMVHVSKKERGQFYNGKIIKIGTDFFIVHDREEGDRFILFSDLNRDLEPFKEKGDGGKGEEGK